MKRKIHEANIREKILKTTRRLIMEQGYQNTTIRQITKECEVEIGTVYHFFKNKEEIFSHIAVKLFDLVRARADENVDEKDVCLRFVREVRLHFQILFRDEKSRELYLVAYHSPEISKAILAKHVERSIELFRNFCPNFTDEDFVVRGLFTKGYLQAIAVECYNNPQMETSQIVPKTLRLMLQAYNIPQDLITKTLEKG